ncbi:MAG: helix-turn-helix domain-containing protein [Candidatus Aminicenantales bacterium]
MCYNARMGSEYLSKKDLMAYLRVSKGTVENLMREGLPHVKLKRRVLFRLDLVDKWLEARMVRAKKP